MITVECFDKEEYIQLLDEEFAAHGKKRKEGYYHRCYMENATGDRVTLLGFYNNQLAGCCHLLMKSMYPLFAEKGIPEINDLNVFSEYQKKGIANMMFVEFERIALEKSIKQIGIGVGLYKDYGAAQIMYHKRGFIPDGTGIKYNGEEIVPGSQVQVDDDLALYFIKNLA